MPWELCVAAYVLEYGCALSFVKKMCITKMGVVECDEMCIPKMGVYMVCTSYQRWELLMHTKDGSC